MIRGLTLYQPMAWAIAHGHKRIENRPWRPWSGVTHVAIHAGQRWSDEHAAQIEALGVRLPPTAAKLRGFVLAVARIDKVVASRAEAEAWGGFLAAWYSGPIGWCLADVVALRHPVRCNGARGMWALPDPVLEAIRAQGVRLP